MITHAELLNQILDDVFFEADMLGIDNITLAAKAGLCYTTVWRLEHRETRYPHFRTVVSLVKAVSLKVVLDFAPSRKKKKKVTV